MFDLDFNAILLTVGTVPVTIADATVLGAALFAFVVLTLLFAIWRGARTRRMAEAQDRQRLAELTAMQNELGGRLAMMQESVATGQATVSRQLEERLDSVTGRVSQNLSESREKTDAALAKLQERLGVIDRAQDNIQSLARDVVGLQSILQDKQTRGAFGERRMEAIVRDALPLGTFDFQVTLSNRARCDCIVHMPNDAPPLVIDAKFPLEAWNLLRGAETEVQVTAASQQFRRDMEVHLKAISEKYLIHGETQDTAFLFVPSESIFAEIHDNFEGVVERAHKERVVIVSPSLLMLSVQVVQALLKDARMREQAHLIQTEIAKFSDDLSRLDDRVRKLKGHFDSTAKDVDMILTSTGKLTRHGERIEAMEFGAQQIAEDERGAPGKPFLRAIEGGD